MQVSPQTQAVLLLTAHFSKPRQEDVKPLTPTEWGRFALWLKHEERDPESLLHGDLHETLANWSDREVSEERIATLLNRGSALAIAMEKWQRSGLWVLARSDAAYPKRLKMRLKTASPAILFGCGNADILNQKGIAVVGSRNASPADLDYASTLGAQAANAGFSVVSGSAKGVDQAAMLGALNADGTSVGILADSLLRACSSQKYRGHLLKKNLVLVSSYYPEAGFSAGNAMGRNKYIYCMSEAAVVVHSGRKGGTWSGALETIKKGWVPIWVKPTGDASAGNADIVNQGAQWAPEAVSAIDFDGLVESAQPGVRKERGADLFAMTGHDPGVADTSDAFPATSAEVASETTRATAIANDQHAAIEFYELFLLKLQETCKDEPRSTDELAEQLELSKAQLNIWLKKAVAEDRIEKLTRPVRYRWQDTVQQQTIFSD